MEIMEGEVPSAMRTKDDDGIRVTTFEERHRIVLGQIHGVRLSQLSVFFAREPDRSRNRGQAPRSFFGYAESTAFRTSHEGRQGTFR